MAKIFPNQKITSTRVDLAKMRNNFGIIKKIFLSIRDTVNAEKDEKKISELRKQIDDTYERGHS